MAHSHLQIHLIQCELTTIHSEWNARDVCSGFWRLYINNRDGARIWCEDGPHPLPAGKMHLVPAYVRFSCQNATEITHFYAHFDLLGLTPLLQKRLFQAPVSLPLTAAARRLQGAHLSGRRVEDSPELGCLCQSVMWEALWQIVARLAAAERSLLQSAFADSDRLRPAMQLIEQRLPRPTPVPAMARACNLSEDHYIRAFRSAVGQTPARYVLEKRLSLAARALLFGSASIDQIALEHGFANRFHFSRAFTRVLGSTPAAYRRSARV